MKLKIFLIWLIIIMCLISCLLFNDLDKNDLKNCKWIYYTSNNINNNEMQIICFTYEEILFLNPEKVGVHHFSGCMTPENELIYLKDDEYYMLNYIIEKGKVLIFFQNEKLIFKIDKNSNLILNNNIIFKKEPVDKILLPILQNEKELKTF